MRILITGGAGYIGTILVPMLLERGHHVTVLDTFKAGTPDLSAACLYDGFEPIKGDARDTRILDDLVPKHDVLVPLAALVGAPLCKEDAIGATTLNRDAVVALVQRAGGEQMIVYPTTNSGYGVGETGKFCTEESPLRPISLYGTTKVEAEKAVLDSGRGVSLRLATVFGMAPRMRLDLLVNDFTHRAVTDRALLVFEGHFKRNYIHIRDVAKGFIHAMDNHGRMRGEAYNLGLSSANLSKLELCERIKAHVPNFVYVEAPIGEDPDKRDYIVSNEKLEATGWFPDFDLDRGIKELIKGFRMIRNSRFANV
ncbi:NAD-dependent epimerase/dehydratase [Methylobacterium sp. GXF4]|jgi:nucleoside-diphosphate-sugar epimerase|uniref:NAD-dependent epimerase/dehydratase family protein n=1 Tax=Methylobacterium sp. GXF4 TaxID=1096546 RepID=UPI000269A8CD|nr:NAD(P)-dependent oxidoreductase [Methylobacterium sp. GXF4]EIZ86806.1 NAD-dependent epimerase/dehydratase [Methylobacterium sp. GXF4]MDF2598648.1 UDP-glucose 4-epimerase [Methylobacterium brachiatum]CAA2159063.1 CDP-paratose 2-epimerase [Methylobacterium brachiatum]